MNRRPNARVLAWFDEGNAVPALLGDGDFFVPGVTYRDHHDQGLILRQLCFWADERDAWPAALSAIATSIRTAGDRGDLETAFRLAWTAVVVADDAHEQLIEPDATLEYLDARLRDVGDGQAQDPEVVAIAQVLMRRLRPHPT